MVLLTLRISQPKNGDGCSLSDILEPPEKVPPKYYISEKSLKTLVLHKKRHAAKKEGFGFTVKRPSEQSKTLAPRDGSGGAKQYVDEGIHMLTHWTAHGNYRVYGADGKARTLQATHNPTGLYQIAHMGENRMAERVYDPDGNARAITALGGGAGSKTGLYATLGKYGQGKRVFDADGKSHTLTAGDAKRQDGYAIPILTPDRAKKMQNGRRCKTDGEPMFTLTAQDGHGVITPSGIRRLMPIECERLQGFPDNYTAGQPDTTRYEQLGNAVCVPVVEHVLKLMEAEYR